MKNFGQWLTERLGCKTQKISINAGFTCPNRDGRVGVDGCTYCNNQTFNPEYCRTEKSVTQQLEEGKRFFGKKYPDLKYLAYFQAYTNTYAPLSTLKLKYEEALAVPDVIGLVIATRPDCVDEALLDHLASLAADRQAFVLIEYGIESVYDRTLLRINRGHDFACTQWAVAETAKRGIPCGGHVILGLPGESRADMINEARILSSLPLSTLKLHQLQLIKGTKMAEEFFADPSDFLRMTAEEYADLVVEFLQNLRSDIILERFVSQSPASLLAVPGWGLKNYQFTALVNKRLCRKEQVAGSKEQVARSR